MSAISRSRARALGGLRGVLDELLAVWDYWRNLIAEWWLAQSGLWFADDFIANLMLFRVAWIRGRLGGGKTLLSVALADKFFKLGYVDGAITNFPTVYPPALRAEDGTLIDRIVLFDEAWQHFDNRDSLINERYAGAYARKMGVFWVFPSVHPVDKRLRSVIVWRSAVLPFNVWIYRWTLELDYDDAGGWFVLVNPQQYFDFYDTRYIPYDDGGIRGRFDRTMDELTQGHGLPDADEIRDYLAEIASLGVDVGDIFGGAA